MNLSSKKLITLCLFSMATLLLSAQTADDNESRGIDIEELKANSKAELEEEKSFNALSHSEPMPEFPGGDQAMAKFIINNLAYPQKAIDYGVEGRVILRIIIDKNGDVKAPRVLRGIDYSCDNEALRLVKAMPRWTPGKKDRENVAVYYTLPITFRLPTKIEDVIVTDKLETSNFSVAGNDSKRYVIVKDTPLREDGYGTVTKPLTVVEQMPQYPGGNQEMMKFIHENLRLPQEEIDAAIYSRIVVRFIVDENGNIVKPQIARRITPKIDKEVLRVVNLMPKWIPGKQNGEYVATYYSLPISLNLRLNDKTED